MFRSTIYILCMFVYVQTALACNDIYFLRDGRKIHTEPSASGNGECNEVAHGIVESPLKDGYYHLKEGGTGQGGVTGVVHKGCWAILRKGTILSTGEEIYTAVFNDRGDSPYILKNEFFHPLKDGSYTVKESGDEFTVTNGVIDDLGFFNKDGQLMFEDRN